MIKEKLRKAFKAGIKYRNNCNCGDCPVDPDFEEWYKQQSTKAPVKVVTDEDIQYYVTAAHPDTIGNKPLQILMREKIRISLEWMRKQLTGE